MSELATHDRSRALQSDGWSRGSIRRALIRDAIYQVLDNKVFRILMFLVLLMVGLTFAIGFREDEVVLLWGVKTYFYEDFLEYMGFMFGDLGAVANQREVITFVQMFFVDFLAGTLGLFICVSATVFFVPRMLEKGAADPLFSKPVSRWSLLFARYVSGLVFVAFLATALIGGMHLGLLLNSGYSDPGFLWSIPTLVYLFALISAFSTLFGVLTRSTVATLLLTLMAWGFTTAIHSGWTVYEFATERELLSGQSTAPEDVTEELDWLVDILTAGLKTTHYVLPKTLDADRIAQLSRDTVTSELFIREELTLEADGERFYLRVFRDGDVELRDSEGDWVRRQRHFREDGKVQRMTVDIADDELEIFPNEAPPRATFAGADIALRPPGDEEVVAPFEDPFTWYSRKFQWDAEWKFNPFFSLATSLAFVAGALGLAWLRLRRMSF